MEITFEIEGEQKLSRALDVAARGLDDMKPFYDQAIDILSKHSDQLFSTDGSAAESVPKWQPHASSTKKARQKRWGYYANTPSNPGLLRWTGKMQDSKKKTVTAKYGELDFTDKKALYHWKGGGKNKLPSRKILELSPNLVNREIVRALQSEIFRQIGRAGLQTVA